MSALFREVGNRGNRRDLQHLPIASRRTGRSEMKNIAFAIWIVGWPFVSAFSRMVDFGVLQNHRPESWHFIDHLFRIALWIAVAWLLYERPGPQARTVLNFKDLNIDSIQQEDGSPMELRPVSTDVYARNSSVPIDGDRAN